MAADGTPWLPGGVEAAAQYAAGRIWFQTGRWYWLSMANPHAYIPTIPGATDENRPAFLANVAWLESMGVDITGDHPHVPGPAESSSWFERIEAVWGVSPPVTSGEWPPGVDPWLDLPLLDSRYPEDFSDGFGEYFELQGTRVYSDPTVPDHGFPSPRDYNRAVEEFLALVMLRYKLAMQVARILFFGVSGGRPRNEDL